MSAITVLGGTGYAGAHIVAEAASRGHRVTSVSRSLPETRVEGVEYVTGDVVAEVPDLSGADVVIAALSPRGDNAGALRAAYARLAEAASRAGARFVAIGGFSALRPAPGAPRIAEGDGVPEEFRAEAVEMAEILSDLLDGDQAADWLFVSPAATFGAYVPGERLGHYRSGGEVAVFDDAGVSAISGADFALAVIDEVEKAGTHRAQINFAY